MLMLMLASCGPAPPPGESSSSSQAGPFEALQKKMETLYDAVHNYARDTGRFPPAGQGLEALVRNGEPADSLAKWHGPYLETPMLDSWDQPFNYKPTPDAMYPYALTSSGPNGIPWDEDDVPIDGVRERRNEIYLTFLAVATTIMRMHIGRYPTQEEGLSALYVEPEGVTDWRGPYGLFGPLAMHDPWNRPYQYTFEMRDGKPWYDVWSLGPDGIPSEDDRHVRELPNAERLFVPDGAIPEGLIQMGKEFRDQSQ